MTATPDSKQRILAAAEELFGERGFDATSLRAVTAAAGVNLAAVHYHFGSKSALIQEVFARHLEPLNRERIRLLDACEGEADGCPALEAILHAFVAPAFRMRADPSGRGHCLLRLFGRTHSTTDPQIKAAFMRQFDEVRVRFLAALQHVLPDLPTQELHWRLHFAIGTLAQSMAEPERLTLLSNGEVDPSDIEASIEQLVPFLAAGMRAPLPGGRPREARHSATPSVAGGRATKRQRSGGGAKR